MSKISLAIGSIIYYSENQYKVKKIIDMSSIIGEHLESHKCVVIPISEIYYSNPSNINLSDDTYLYSDENWSIARKRFEIIKPLLGINRTEAIVTNRAIDSGVDRATLYRWLKEYEKNDSLSSLIPRHSLKGGIGKLKIREETELIIAKTIDDLYLTKQKLTIKKVYNEIVRKCSNAKVDPPHENTVRNRINAISDRVIVERRESRILADRKYRNTDGVFPEGTFPLDVVQIDHTPMDLIIVDEKYRRPIGRPYLTLAIDVYSRMVVGIYISLDEPSYFSVAQCLSCAVLQKDRYLRNLQISGEWNIWGLPRSIHMDNAQEFRGKELQRVCDQYGVTIAWRPVARPQFGGHIERLIGTVMRELHSLPGTTFSNINQRGEYNSEKEAVMTLADLESYVVEFVVNVYHKRLHSGIGAVPEKRFEEGIFGSDSIPGCGLPVKVENEDKFKISLLPTIERTIQQFGVKIDKIIYYSDAIRKWIRVKENLRARKFIFKRDPRDISTIWFLDPDLKEYFPLPYRNVTYPPISMWDLRMAQRYLEEKNLLDINEEHIFAAYDKLQTISEEAAKKTKSTRRYLESKKVMQNRKKLDGIGSNGSVESSIGDVKKSLMDDDMFADVVPFDEIEII